jgi:hypothetical protein
MSGRRSRACCTRSGCALEEINFCPEHRASDRQLSANQSGNLGSRAHIKCSIGSREQSYLEALMRCCRHKYRNGEVLRETFRF